MVGTPNLRTPPSGFGISTRLTGDGVYVGPSQQLVPMLWPVRPQVIRELLDGHSVDARTPFVRLDATKRGRVCQVVEKSERVIVRHVIAT